MIPIHVLIIEDSVDDTELLLREFRQNNYEPVHERVETASTMSRALAAKNWDLIISDFNMPHFNAFAALELLHATEKDIPFIIVSGTIGEDRAVNAMKLGAHDYILKGNLKRLIPAVKRELGDAKVRKERHNAYETIRHFAYVDPVTELPNRIRFRELLQDAIHSAQYEQRSIALLLLDLDRFKEVNDTLGHNRGDNLLLHVASRLRNALFEHDVVGRLGGDEFGILLPKLAKVDDVKIVIKNLRNCLLPPFMIDDIPIMVECSIGVALMPEHADDANALLQRADIAMYQAKKMASGYAIYAAEFNPYSPERLGLMGALSTAIEQNQLVLHYQPKLDIKTERIIGTEALVRWQHPRLGLVPPDQFILDAEKTGMIGPLTHWVLVEALTHCRNTRQECANLVVSVNLSARSLHDPRLPHTIENLLKESGIEPGKLMLEVTESAIVLEPKRAEENLVALSSIGILLSIDDFGTGYTSMSSIKRLPVNEIKIDKSFVTHMLTDQQDAMIVRTIIDFAHNFDLTVVAEGVENKEVYDALASIGCDVIQGYYISRPLTAAKLKTWLSDGTYKI